MIDLKLISREWTGTAEELAQLVNGIEANSIDAAYTKLTARTVTFYRTKEVLTGLTGKKFGYKQILQCLLAREMTRRNFKLREISVRIATLQIHEVENLLRNGFYTKQLVEKAKEPDSKALCLSDNTIDEVAQPSDAVLATRLLAKGVLNQYLDVEQGAIVDGNTSPKSLKQALAMLGKLRIQSGLEDNCGSVHEVLNRCKRPLGDMSWNIPAFQEDDFPFKNVILVDSDHRCPTVECMELGNFSNDLDLREKYSFDELTNICGRFGAKRHWAYTQLRKFIAENPTTSISKIDLFLYQNDLRDAGFFLKNRCYRPVSSADLHNGQLWLCQSCGAPLHFGHDEIARCRIKQCQQYTNEQSLVASPELADDMLVLTPHIQLYWFGPSIDELTIYNHAILHDLNAELFPNSDECDVSINGLDIGIDVKSHTSPILLARSLNASIGGLKKYDEKIIAINDNSVVLEPNYIDLMYQYYRGKTPIEFYTVSKVLEWLED